MCMQFKLSIFISHYHDHLLYCTIYANPWTNTQQGYTGIYEAGYDVVYGTKIFSIKVCIIAV